MTIPPSPTPQQLRWIADLEGLLSAVAATGATPSIYGHLRIRSRDRSRDVLLGSRTVTAAAVTVVDWHTAPLAEVFFRYRPGDDYELDVDDRVLIGTVVARHRLDVTGGRLMRVVAGDVVLSRHGDGWIAVPANEDPVLPVLDPVRRARAAAPVLDAEQQRAVELPADESLVVDGEAGVGKTWVAMHRLAWLRTRALDAGRRFRAVVLAPTPGLVRLCQQLAERLGVEGLEISTLDDWLTQRGQQAFPGLPERSSDDAPAAVVRLKRHPAVRVALAELAAPHRSEVDEELGFSPERALLLELFGDRTRLERVVTASGGELGDREIDAVLAHTHVQYTETTEEQYRHVDADRLIAVDHRRLDDGTPFGDAESFDVEDVPVLFALARRRGDPPADLPSYDHIVIDEAQLVAPLELAAIGAALARGGSVTIAGDHRQETDDSAWFRGWDAAIAELGVQHHHRVTLAIGYRSAPPISDFARALAGAPARPPQTADQPDIAHRGRPTPPAVSVTRSQALQASAYADDFHWVAAVSEALDALITADPRQRIAVIARTPAQARRVHRDLGRAFDATLVVDGAFTFDPGVVIAAAPEVHGLEFDAVVIADASADIYPIAADARRALYVAVTRARDWLWLTTAGPWTPLIDAAA